MRIKTVLVTHCSCTRLLYRHEIIAESNGQKLMEKTQGKKLTQEKIQNYLNV